MSGELKVTTAHVRGLAGKQGEIATEIESARAATDAVLRDVLFSHGAICGSANDALAVAVAARDSACAAMREVSTGLEEHLTAAAAAYDAADASTTGALDQSMLGGGGTF
jgi:hypothetical protein